MSRSSKEADVVFWTRVGTGKPDEEDMEKMEKRQKQNLSGEDEEKDIIHLISKCFGSNYARRMREFDQCPGRIGCNGKIH
jgi:hypothetical protein